MCLGVLFQSHLELWTEMKTKTKVSGITTSRRKSGAFCSERCDCSDCVLMVVEINGKTYECIKTSSRHRVELEDVIIKFDADDGFNQGSEEWELWNERIKGTEWEKYFVPILEFGEVEGWEYVVQPKVEMREEIPEGHINRIRDTLMLIEEEFGFNDIWISDNYLGNATYVNDDILIYDYGI